MESGIWAGCKEIFDGISLKGERLMEFIIWAGCAETFCPVHNKPARTAWVKYRRYKENML